MRTRDERHRQEEQVSLFLVTNKEINKSLQAFDSCGEGGGCPFFIDYL